VVAGAEKLSVNNQGESTMSKLGVEGLRAERDTTLTIAKSLTDDEWNSPSDCAGWAVRDVIAHMASVLHGVVDPSMMPDLSGGTEDGMEAPVAERRAWTIEDVLAEYETYSAQVADLGASLQDPPMSDTLLPMGDLGTHPMAIMPSTFLFDNYCHLRNDILKPNGPIDRPEPPRDEKRIAPTVEWMLAGLPWMCTEQLAFIDRAIELVLSGIGGGTWWIGPGGEADRALVSDVPLDGAVASVTSDTHDFVIWGTRRRPWAQFTTITGDDAYAGRVLDGFQII
jgi:uncharacterized protein (TIGR03083 family)